MVKWNKAYKYRIYPTAEQCVLFAKTFGCCRKIYNLMLADKIMHYKDTGTLLKNTPAHYKEEYPFLKEVDSLALANEQLHLETAYNNFFRRPDTGFPKFKTKHRDKPSYTTSLVSNNIVVHDDGIRLPKLGVVPARIHRKAPDGYKLKSVTVSRETDGTYYASVLYEYIPVVEPVSPTTSISHIGLDYKSDGLFVSSDGGCADMPHFYCDAQRLLRKEQRKLSHKIEAHIIRYDERNSKRYPVYDKPLSECKNIQKQRIKVAKLSRHVANARKDFLHKCSAEMTNRYELISVESLGMKSMASKKSGNGKATLDNGYGMFLSMLEYKQREKGHYLIKVDKWYPSSQLCHVCGHKEPSVKDLHIRHWVCPCCGSLHDRDVNASINIDNEGLRQFLAG